MAEKTTQACRNAGSGTRNPEVGLLDQILTEGKMARDDFQKERAKDMIGEFVGQVMSGELTMSKNMDVAINARIAEIDRLITRADERNYASRGLSKTRRLVARTASSGQKQFDRHAAQNSRDERQRKKTFSKISNARSNSTNRRCSKKFTKMNTARSAARRSAL
jgi:hypothetical protein